MKRRSEADFVRCNVLVDDAMLEMDLADVGRGDFAKFSAVMLSTLVALGTETNIALLIYGSLISRNW